LEQLINLDKELFLFLNGLGSEPFDGFWKIITKQIYWSPLFITVFYLLQKKVGWKGLGIIVLFLAALIRPCNNPEFDGTIREVITRKSFSFFSGHASNSFASTTFIVLILRNYYKHTYLLFLFPLIFAYSRIYLGLHYPGDILTGYVFGATFGFVFYKLYLFINKKYF
jgi:undecaprenyl-diphosphatase